MRPLSAFSRLRTKFGDALARYGERWGTKRNLDAGEVGRLFADWVTQSTSTDYELRKSLRALRARSREERRTNSLVGKFARMARTNIVGEAGFTLQVMAKSPDGKLDKELNRKIEDLWREWTDKRTITVTEKLTWHTVQLMAVERTVIDGECLIRKRNAGNRFGIALQLIGADWLDETHNEALPSGNRVIMGVELDPDDRPVAYHLKPPQSEATYRQLRNQVSRVRVPASEILHVHLPEAPDQTRGVPETRAALGTLRMLRGFTEAVLVGIRTAACMMGILKPPADSSFSGKPRMFDEAFEPGTFKTLPPGYDFSTFSPEHPNAQFETFVKATERQAASALGVDHPSLSSNLEGVNYSSIRAGYLEVRDRWRMDQRFYAENFCREIYRWWLGASLLRGLVTPEEYARASRADNWKGRGFEWVDPLKEVTAKKLELEMYLTNYSHLLDEKGRDFEEVLRMRKEETDLAAELGITLPTGGVTVNVATTEGD